MTSAKTVQTHNSSQSKNYSLSTYLTFIIPSMLGIFLFMVPIHYNDQYSIPIALFSKWLLNELGDNGKCTVSALVLFMTISSLVYRIYQPYLILQYKWLHRLFYPSLPWFIIRTLGGVLIVVTLLQIGPEFIWGTKSGTIMREIILPGLLTVFVFTGLFLPLLLNFGLIEFIGSLLDKIMRPVFKLPGRSAVDCLASWLGDSVIAILMTNKQYEEKKYTQKEAAIIATTFSTVSITFCLFVISYVNLEYLFLPFYVTVCLSGLVAAIILPHIPPLSYKQDRYIDGSSPDQNDSLRSKTSISFTNAYAQALARAEKSNSLKKVTQESCINVIEMVLGLLPVVMVFGTLSLIIAEYTPLLSILSKPFVYYLNWLGVADASQTAQTIASGFSNMIQPAHDAVSIDNQMNRFIIAAVSVSQLIYMIEVGALLLSSKIPVNIFELLLIFVLRTIITLPVIVGIANLIFNFSP